MRARRCLARLLPRPSLPALSRIPISRLPPSKTLCRRRTLPLSQSPRPSGTASGSLSLRGSLSCANSTNSRRSRFAPCKIKMVYKGRWPRMTRCLQERRNILDILSVLCRFTAVSTLNVLRPFTPPILKHCISFPPASVFFHGRCVRAVVFPWRVLA